MMLEQIPFTPDVDAVLAQLGLDDESELTAEVCALAARAAGVSAPKVLFREAFITARDEETVAVDGVTFTSRALSANLAEVERVFPYVATCGVEFDTLLAEMDDDFLAYALDVIKEAALFAAMNHFQAYLADHYGVGHHASMHPGSADADIWPIEQQAPLFALLGEVTARIGVVLTDTFLMHPNKTVSGILFPTAVDFVTCQLCHRADCPNRRAPFDEHLWREKHGGGR